MNQFDLSPNTVKAPLRIGIVGMGLRSTSFVNHFANTPTDGRIVAVCDTVPEKGKYIIDHFNVRADVFDNVHTMIEKCPMDALFISTPDYAHVEPAKAALAANIHVFCEKPLATTLEDCDRIIEAARNSSAIFYLGFNLRHGPVHETVHELISSGQVGKVTTIEANEWYYGGKTYFRRWNRLIKYGGGLWVTKACHDFDLLNWMAAAEPLTVYAVGSLSHYNPLPEAADQCRNCDLQFTCPDYFDVFDVSDPASRLAQALRQISEKHGQGPADLCLFNSDKDTFDNGMAQITYANDIRATYTVNVLAARSTRQMRVVGTEGQIEADLELGKVTFTQRHTHKQAHYDLTGLMKSGHGGADSRLIKDFIHTVHTGKKPRTSWAEGKLAVQVSLAAQRSMQTHQVVSLQ